MATDVILPVLGMAQDTGKIVEWLKTEGEYVTQGEPLVVIETDKAAVDLEAPASGILARITAAAGDEVPVAQVIAVILADGETANIATTPAATAGADSTAASTTSAPLAPADSFTNMGVNPTTVGAMSGSNGRRLASPKARRMASECGLDIATLRGTGPGGVVLAADVLAASTSAVQSASTTVMTPSAMTVTTAPAQQQRSTLSQPDAPTMSTTWRLMAERTTQSWTTIPHFFLAREVDAGQLVAWRERAAQQATEKITFSDLLIKIVAEALRRHPRLNASWTDGNIRLNDEVNIGLAVAVEDGLIVPVIHQADDLTLNGIARRRTDLVSRAQVGKLRLRDLQDGTFTISNLGMYGIDAFNAIINAPQVAILAVGRVADRIVPVNGQPTVRSMLTLTLSCDHRVVDGARGAQFLATVAELIEGASAFT
ncbi:MAG: Dihydrolipoamide acetyltransferase component of pyruvate dehydrogenase complex [Ktedonobacterales bacterium]|jgi:pyruvate dehydrogenase E2 component (dihydrolipoamide acetyltransferase)|nr:MAG: Dihydrolipoamide acetyltransferase component of pyruvate dehydrogenase complex [Ktedonobacterales bacterium]